MTANIVEETVKPTKRSRTNERPFRITDFSGVYHLGRGGRVKIIKKGVPASEVRNIAKTFGIPKERLIEVLGLSRATVDRLARSKKQLSTDQGERVLGLSKLVGQVQVMVEESGNPEGFDAARWVADWLDRPSAALGGRCPAEYMDTAEGQELVSDLIATMQSGAYA
jgi:putative toxin-antitoxin system antitoxin component (TIGR02293 family)